MRSPLSFKIVSEWKRHRYNDVKSAVTSSLDAIDPNGLGVEQMDEHASADRFHEALKQLDPTDIKILSTMARVGPRNILEVSRVAGISFTTFL